MSAQALQHFLAHLGRRRWRWGETDCLLVLADWVARVRGIDPALRYRGTYHDAAGAEALLAGAGGLLALVSNTLHVAGFTATSAPQPGDVAVVRAPCARGEGIALADTGAIVVTESLYAVLTPDAGVVVHAFPLRAAWKV